MAETRHVDWVDAESNLDVYDAILFFPSNARLQKMLKMPLRFKDQALETAYVGHVKDVLLDWIQVMGFAGLWALQGLLGIYMIFVFNFEQPTIFDVEILCLWFLFTLIGCCRKRLAKCGERAVVFMALFLYTLACMSHPDTQAYLLSLVGQPHDDLAASSGDVHVTLSLLILVTMYQFHIRSTICWTVIPLAPTSYLICTLPMTESLSTSLGRHFAIAIGTLALNIVLFLGRCNTEILDRTEFVRIQQVGSSYVKEKVLRVTAERNVEPQMLGRSRLGDDLVSAPESHYSSLLFQPTGGDRQTQLKALIQTGMVEQWLLRPEQVACSFRESLGKGGFGQVFRGTCSGVEAAMKVLFAPSSQDGLGSVASELRILRKIRHANIVAFYGACILPHADQIILVEELVNGLKLSAVVGYKLPGAPQCQHLLSGACSGLAYLHTHQPPIVHSDLKPGNIMVERHLGAVRLIDFGLSRFHSSRLRGKTGTTRWQAPETLTAHVPDSSSDIYSFGCIAYYVKTGQIPYEGESGKRLELLRKALLEEGVDVPFIWPDPPVAMQDECKALCAMCVTIDPAQRARAADLLQCLAGWFPPDEPDHESPAERALREGIMLVTLPLEDQGSRAVDQAKRSWAL
eukprot:TRINITY_DN14714_c0_g1_i4.p1 TRINITY_DN14714_c0_g1~~TRINITY_DN14714_c0_g1_i4.p1  ORF type:complete len:630 (+),score=90.59 TRINITY_DN14714_c0_g1_i4:61-1950(+)